MIFPKMLCNGPNLRNVAYIKYLSLKRSNFPLFNADSTENFRKISSFVITFQFYFYLELTLGAGDIILNLAVSDESSSVLIATVSCSIEVNEEITIEFINGLVTLDGLLFFAEFFDVQTFTCFGEYYITKGTWRLFLPRFSTIFKWNTVRIKVKCMKPLPVQPVFRWDSIR